MIIQQTILKTKTDPTLSCHGNTLRGNIASQFPQYDILHNHKKDGNLLYLYPRIQYRTIKGEGLIIGIEEGTSIIRTIEPVLKIFEIKEKKYNIIQKQLISEEVNFGIADCIIKYHFEKPWLALNEKNYSEYNKIKNRNNKDIFLANILVGNLLSISKSLGYIVEKEIIINSLALEEIQVYLKGTPMLGFLGTFSVNFEIPDYWGIGKSVSRGFGTIKFDRCL